MTNVFADKHIEFADKHIEGNPDSIILRGKGTTSGLGTNVPHFVTHYSPDGFEWGYMGSGPADLALNILEAALRRLKFHGAKTTCWRGKCYQVAWELHQEYNREVIAAVPYQGTVMDWVEVYVWLMNHSPLVKDWVESLQGRYHVDEVGLKRGQESGLNSDPPINPNRLSS